MCSFEYALMSIGDSVITNQVWIYLQFTILWHIYVGLMDLLVIGNVNYLMWIKHRGKLGVVFSELFPYL